jgi:peroxiredoxin
MIKQGQDIPPNIKLYYMAAGDQSKPQDITTGNLLSGKNVLLFGVPGAFTQVCAQQQLPDYMDHMDEFEQLGVELVACISTNDPYVMQAWGMSAGVTNIKMLSDPTGEFHKQLGLMQQVPLFSDRPRRYAMYIQDGTVKVLKVEDVGDKVYSVCKPKDMIAAMRSFQ